MKKRRKTKKPEGNEILFVERFKPKSCYDICKWWTNLSLNFISLRFTDFKNRYMDDLVVPNELKFRTKVCIHIPHFYARFQFSVSNRLQINHTSTNSENTEGEFIFFLLIFYEKLCHIFYIFFYLLFWKFFECHWQVRWIHFQDVLFLQHWVKQPLFSLLVLSFFLILSFSFLPLESKSRFALEPSEMMLEISNTRAAGLSAQVYSFAFYLSISGEYQMEAAGNSPLQPPLPPAHPRRDTLCRIN